MTEALRPQRGLDAIKPYVPGRPVEDVRREYGLDDVIKLASNENPLGVSPKALASMQEAISRLNHYPDGAGLAFRTALADHFGIELSQVAIGNGADDLILELSLAYLEDEDEVVTSRSSFPMYDIYTAAMRARMVKTPLTGNFGLDLKAMADTITDRTKIVYVCNPNNPTGTIVEAPALESFLARIPESVLVVMDEAYAEMVECPQFPDSLRYVRDGTPNVVVLRTFSKVYGLAGIRIGYAFAPPDVVSVLMKIKPPFNVNVLAQVAGIAALGDQAFVQRSVAENRRARENLYRAFDRMKLEYAESHTNFVLVKIGPQAGQVHQSLLRRGIIVRPCIGYDLPDHLRISLGTVEENQRFIHALEEILAES
jgi:histidinol-phosphate aminotransferase